MSGAALAQPGLKQFFPSEGAATVSGKPAAMHKMGGTDVHNWGITFQAEKSQGATSAAQCYSCETKQSPNSYLSENMYISTRK